MRKSKIITVITITLVLAAAVISVIPFVFFRYHKHAVEAMIGRALGAAV